MKNLCEVCRKREHKKLCDHATNSGIITSSDFQELTKTCDKKMCNECAITLWPNCDICPDHAEEVRDQLTEELKGWLIFK